MLAQLSMDRCVIIAIILESLLTGTGLAQLRDPPRLFNRITSFNCLIYPHAFHCVADNGCIPPERVHDGIKDCPDGSDESSGVNICDYAPYFPDFRCSAYADCIPQPDGYACRCRSGYFGPGETCQPAPLNMPQFVTSAKPLIIQTWRTDTTAAMDHYINATSLHDLGTNVLERTTPRLLAQPENEGNASISASALWGARLTSRHPSKVTVREYRNIEESDSPAASSKKHTTTAGLIQIVPSARIVCRSRSLMINESGQVWCLGLFANGSVDRASAVRPSTPPQLQILSNLPANFIPTTHANSPANGTGWVTVELANTTEAGVDENAATSQYRHVAEFLEKLPKFVVTTSKDKQLVINTSTPYSVNYEQSDASKSKLTDLQASQGFNGVTEDGAMFGYMPTQSTSRKPGSLSNPEDHVTAWAPGSIITPIKIWNATGGALMAYKITANTTLPISCLNAPVRMFLCANRGACIRPEKLLDGHEDCGDGSDEVPEFIDECSFAVDWPRFQCGDHADCTDTAPGYICKCNGGYFWDGNTCVIIPSNLSALSQKVIDDLIRMDGFTGTPVNAANALRASLNASNLPASVDILVYPGGSTWSVRSSNSGLSPLSNYLNQSNPYVVLPNCEDCIRPEFVTLGPTENAAQQSEGRDPNRSVSRTYNSSNHSNLSLPSVDDRVDLQQRNTANPNTNESNAGVSQFRPGATIAGVFSPSSQINTRSDKSNTSQINSAHNERSPNSSAATNNQNSQKAGTSSDRDWQAVLDALSRFKAQSSSTTSNPIGNVPLDSLATNQIFSNISNAPAKQGGIESSSSTNRTNLTPSVTSSTGGRQQTLVISTLPTPSISVSRSTMSTQGRPQSGIEIVTPQSNEQHLDTTTVTASRFNIAGLTISNVPPFSSANSSAVNSNTTIADYINSVINGSTVRGMTLTGIGLTANITDVTDTTMTTLPTGTTTTSRYRNGSLPETTPSTTSRPVPPQPDYFTIYRPSRPTLTTLTLPTTYTKDTTGTEIDNDTITSIAGTSHPLSPNAAANAIQEAGTPTKVTSILESSTVKSSASNVASNSNTVRMSSLSPMTTGGVRMNEPLILPETTTVALAIADHGGSNNNTIIPVFLNLSTLRRNASSISLGNNTSGNNNNTVGNGITRGSMTDIHNSARPTAPSSRSDEMDAGTGSSMGTTVAFTTLSPTTKPPTLAVNTSSSNRPQISSTNSSPPSIQTSTLPPQINPLTYPTGVFLNFPTGPQRTVTDSPVVVNDTGIQFEVMYPCFPELFRKAYATLQQNIKSCDKSCDVNATERCNSVAGRCDCLAGSTRTSITGKCQASVQYSVGLTMAELCGKPLLFQSYMFNFSNPTTQQLAVVVCYQMEQLLNKSGLSAGQYSPGSCNPRSFSPGSVVTNVGLSFVPARDDNVLPTELATALGTALNNNQGAVGGDAGGLKVRLAPPDASGRTQTFFQPPSVGDINECDINQMACGVNANCQNTFGAFTCVCRPGYTDTNPAFPGRNCVNSSLIAASVPVNLTIITCPPENFVFANLCLYKTYFILLIIAIILACLLVLFLLACMIYCCCRNCGKEEQYSAPEVALIRAAQRSPRQPNSSIAPLPVGGYQQLKPEGSSLDPNAPRPAPSAMEPDLEKGLNDRSRILPQTDNMSREVENKETIREVVTETKVQSVDKSGNDVDTWEEVEVPTFTEKELAEEASMRALSPSQGSTFSRTQKLEATEAERVPGEPITEESNSFMTISETQVRDDIPEARVLDDDVPMQKTEIQEGTLQRTEPMLEEDQIRPVNKDSIGSVEPELLRTEYELPPSPSNSVKQLAAAKLSARKYHLEAQSSIRRASSETREWLAIPRTESLVMEDDGMDVDTLPHRSYDKDPLYSMNSPVAGTDTRFDDNELRRLGMGFRDSFDDVMEQTSRFYKESSSDVEFEREVDLSQLKDIEAQQASVDQREGKGKDDESSDDDDQSDQITSIQRQPAYVLEQRGNVSSIEPLDEELSDTERNGQASPEDRQSLKSNEEEELKNLGGSQMSLKDRKLTTTEADAHDDVINEIVKVQPAFYSRQASSDEEMYDTKEELKEKIMAESIKMNLPDGGLDRKPSEVQREIAIKEFGALGERDSIDDMLDRTQPFFSRTSTLDSFQLQKNDSTDDATPSSRKPSQSLLAVDNNASLEQSPRKRSLLKKRSAFHSRDSMNKIMETTSIAEDGMGSTEGLRSEATTPQNGNDTEETDKVFADNDASETVVRPDSLPRTMAIDDDDVADFFANKPGDGEVFTETIVRSDNAESEPASSGVLMRSEALPRGNDTGEHLAEAVRKESIQSEHNSPREEFVYENLQQETRVRDSEQDDLKAEGSAMNNDTVVRDDRDETGSPGISNQPLLQQEVALDGKSDAQFSSPPFIPHDSDSGVYVDAGLLDGSSASRRKANIMSSQDDLQILEGQEARRNGSGSSYQRLSQSDDEEEVIKRYSAAYKNKLKKTTKRVRHNYEMGPPESRHVYYSSRPKRMPPNREELDVWKDTTWWRVHRK
ncbi:uncharacterized protein LOC129583564 isoform X2 [Paramacrobiotus metropolitanus]|uniref:uncharacterized protein LOC129583564 isoform X2 n=1 Tax=Paramacrobiotus metropolitanus TaxID=2943436 RepID=UPI00244632C9|nr:uncharacterized protein LOC129583564 isoform X2 [Paramacrobiotus metropolitanus]